MAAFVTARLARTIEKNFLNVRFGKESVSDLGARNRLKFMHTPILYRRYSGSGVYSEVGDWDYWM
jgi:hypothetical protein